MAHFAYANVRGEMLVAMLVELEEGKFQILPRVLLALGDKDPWRGL